MDFRSPSGAKFATFLGLFLSDDVVPEEIALRSSPFDYSASSEVHLNFDEYYFIDPSGPGYLEVRPSTFTDSHSQLDSLKQQLEKLTDQLTESSTRFSKFRRSSLWQRYWTAVAVGVISALITNLLWMIL